VLLRNLASVERDFLSPRQPLNRIPGQRKCGKGYNDVEGERLRARLRVVVIMYLVRQWAATVRYDLAAFQVYYVGSFHGIRPDERAREHSQQQECGEVETFHGFDLRRTAFSETSVRTTRITSAVTMFMAKPVSLQSE